MNKQQINWLIAFLGSYQDQQRTILDARHVALNRAQGAQECINTLVKINEINGVLANTNTLYHNIPPEQVTFMLEVLKEATVPEAVLPMVDTWKGELLNIVEYDD